MLIGEVSEKSGASVRMLRHYDTIGLVTPSERTGGGYRRYSEADIWRLFQVESLRSLGLGLEEVGTVLDGAAASPMGIVTELLEQTRERIAREQELLRRLERVQTAEPDAWSDVLHTIRLLRGVEAGDSATRQRLALSLCFDSAQDAATLVEAVLSEPDTNAAGALDWAVARLGDAAVPELAGALRSPDAARRRRAVEALTKIDTPAALAHLAEAVDHEDPFVAGRATLAQGWCGDVAAVPALVELVAQGRDDVEASEVLGALSREHDCGEEIAAAVVRALDTEDADARVRLAQALGEIPGAATTAALADLVNDANRAIALTARALLQSGEADR